MMNKSIPTFLAVPCLIFSAGSVALDTSKTILCATTVVYECGYGDDCFEVWPEDVNAPTFVRINIDKREIRARKEGPPSKIDHVEEVEDRLVLQGVEDGLPDVQDGSGWTISINTKTGRVVATAAIEQAAIVYFGACTELP